MNCRPASLRRPLLAFVLTGLLCPKLAHLTAAPGDDAMAVEVVPASQRAELSEGSTWNTDWVSARQGVAVTSETLVPEAFHATGLLHVWSLRTGKVLHTIPTPARIQAVAGDGNSPVIFVAGGHYNKNDNDPDFVWMVDTLAGKVLRKLPVWPQLMTEVLPQYRAQFPPRPYMPVIQEGAMSRDGSLFVLKFSDACATYPVASPGAAPRSVPAAAWQTLVDPQATRMAALPNWMTHGGTHDSQLTLGDVDGRASVWRNDTWEEMLTLGPAGTGVNIWSPSADGSVLLALRLDPSNVHDTHLIWDFRTFEVTEWLEPRLERMCLPALTADGSILRFARRTGPRSVEFVSRDWRSGKERIEGAVNLPAVDKTSPKAPDELAAAFSDDGMALGIGTRKGGTIIRWTEPGLSKPQIVNGTLSCDGLGGMGGVACNGSAMYFPASIVNEDYENRPARVWQASTGQTAEVMAVKTLGHPSNFLFQSLPGVPGEVLAYRVSGASAGPYGFGLQTRLKPGDPWRREPNGEKRGDALWTFCGASFVRSVGGPPVLLKYFDSSITTHDPASGRRLASFTRTDLWPWRGLQRRAAAPLAGRLFAALGNGGTQILDVQPDGSLKPIAQLWSPAPGSWLAILPDGHYAISPTAQPPVFFRQGGRLFPVEDFDARLNQPDAVAAALGATPATVTLLREQRQKRLERLGPLADHGSAGSGPSLTLASTPPLMHDAASLPLAGVARTQGTPVTHLELHVNDVPVYGRAGLEFAVPAQGSGTFRLDVPLTAGSNKVQVAARDASGALSVRETFLVHRSLASCRPTRVVFGAGIADYDDPDLQDLTYAPKDATDIAAAITSVPGRFSEVRVKTLADGEARREGILAAREFLKNTKPEDEVIVFVSGHGVINDKGDYLFCAADFRTSGFKNGVSFADLEDLFEGIPALNRLLLVDSCHSGELNDEQAATVRAQFASRLAAKGVVLREARNRKSGPAPAATQSGAVRRAAADVFLDLRRTTGATVLSASGGLEFALEDAQQKNGLFTHAILHTLRQGAATPGATLTSSQLVQSVAKYVVELTEGQQHPEARFTNLATDFPVIASAGLRPPDRPEEVVKRYIQWTGANEWDGLPRLFTCFAPELSAFGERMTPASMQTRANEVSKNFQRRSYRIQNVSPGRPRADGSHAVTYEVVIDNSALMPVAEATRILSQGTVGWSAGTGGQNDPNGRPIKQWMNFGGTFKREALVRQFGGEWKITSLRSLDQ